MNISLNIQIFVTEIIPQQIPQNCIVEAVVTSGTE